ncbi:MAG TPA: hypothetical protein VGS08_01595 [Candidatus Saccharimonadales bacterium]|nr:hypothetical protein [Candidatus Saccharimonadales bacterium]
MLLLVWAIGHHITGEDVEIAEVVVVAIAAIGIIGLHFLHGGVVFDSIGQRLWNTDII